MCDGCWLETGGHMQLRWNYIQTSWRGTRTSSCRVFSFNPAKISQSMTKPSWPVGTTHTPFITLRCYGMSKFCLFNTAAYTVHVGGQVMKALDHGPRGPRFCNPRKESSLIPTLRSKTLTMFQLKASVFIRAEVKDCAKTSTFTVEHF